jgi:predicted pyridoxine 5'-phosphate oxidase superfamily flavin-nucleotide-binding protein
MKSKYHSGELEVQERAGVKETARRVAGVIRSAMPPAAQDFLRSQRIVVVSTVNASGNVWASILTGEPGFMRALDERTLRIDADLVSGDPLSEGLKTGGEIGALIIELSTRRRMKVKGKAELLRRGGMCVHAERVYPLCPKYIQARDVFAGSAESKASHNVQRSENLTEKQRNWIATADTFFIASFHPETGGDASHRGGYPGFVHVLNQNKLLFPDYSGNNMFNTLGNISVNPNAGLLFIDFDDGDTLQVTGKAQVIWEKDLIKKFAGAERLVEFAIDQVIETTDAIPLRWKFLGYSPFNPG